MATATQPASPVHVGYSIELEPPKDSEIPESERSRIFRLITVVTTSLFTILVPWKVVTYVFGVFGFPVFGGFIGFAIGGWLLSRLMPRMLVYNPEWTGYVTQDALFGTMIPYGPGLHLAHWWEQRNASGNFSLKVITEEFTTTASTQTSEVEMTSEYEYVMSLPRLTRAVGVDETTIKEGLTAFISSFQTREAARRNAEQVRSDIGQMNADLATEFMSLQSDRPNVAGITPSIYEQKYGFKTVTVVIKRIKLPSAVQKTRDAKDEATQLYEVMAQLRGTDSEGLRQLVADGTVKPKELADLRNRAMAVSENATMTINVIEGELPAAVAQTLNQRGRGGQS